MAIRIRRLGRFVLLGAIASTAAGRGARIAAAGVRNGSDGQSSVQAKRGESTYLDQCARCHSETLGGTEAGPALVGDQFVRAWTGKTVGDLFVRVRDTMPADGPRRMTDQQSIDVVAYLLRESRLNMGEDTLPVEVSSLSRIVIGTPRLVGPSSRARR